MNPKDYIPKPCHENWSEMTGDNRQKFCDKCSCSVHNLTDKSHQQIMKLRDELGGKLCGAFHAAPKKKVRRIHLPRPILIGASISSLALAACQSEQDQMVLGGVEAHYPPDSQTAPELPEVELMGDICVPEDPEPPKEEPVKEPIKMGKIRMPE